MVALRCGIVDGTRVTLFAGCGIVADSDPDAGVGGVAHEAARPMASAPWACPDATDAR